MSVDDQTIWLNAAFKAIGHYPLDLLRIGVASAMRSADHPSKIVPSIAAVVDPMLRDRQRIATMTRVDDTPALPAPGDAFCTPAEASDILKRLGFGKSTAATIDPPARRDQPPSVDKGRQCRAPTRADYLRLGVDPAVLDRIEAERSVEAQAA